MELVKDFKNLINNPSIEIATASNRKQKKWKNSQIHWSDFLHRLQTPTVTQETFSEFKKMKKDEQGNIKDVGGFVGGSLINGERRAGKVANRSILTLDIDYGDKQVIDLIDMMIEWSYAIYSTHSHSDSKPRLRLIVPLSESITAEQYEPVARKVASMVGMDYFDDTTYQAHRLMYWPSHAIDGDYIFKYNDGELLKPDEMLEEYLDWRDYLEWPQSSRSSDNARMQSLAKKQGDPLTKHGQVGYFCQTYSIESAIEKFLPDVYDYYKDNRYTFVEGSTVGGLVLYEDGKFAYSHHGTDPCSGLLCNAFDLVRLHKFGELDSEAKADTPINRLPSYLAMVDLSSNDIEVKAMMSTVNYEELMSDFADVDFENIEVEEVKINKLPTAEEILEDRKKWIDKLTTNKQGFETTAPNIQVILENDLMLKGKIVYNEFEGAIVIKSSVPWRRIKKLEQWRDVDDSGLRVYLEKMFNISSKGKTEDALLTVVERHKFHPIRSYLNSVEWDGVQRLETLFIDFLGAEDNELNRTITRKAFTAAVARVYQPGIKFDYMLTLTGAQGLGKSMILDVMGGDWYSDSITTVHGKEAYEALQGAWLLEMAELTATKKAEVESIKQFISKRVDRYRQPYGRRVQEFPRQCVFFGTTNDNEFIRDKTGGRRFWPIKVNKDNIKRSWRELKENEELRNQLWAEAKHYYEQKEPLYLNDEMDKQITKVQQAHTEVSPLFGVVEEFLNRKLPENWNKMSISERRMWLSDDVVEIEGTVERDRVCILELWRECLLQNTKMQGADKGELKGIMDNMPGWKLYEGNDRNTLRCGKGYGPQPSYIREKNVAF